MAEKITFESYERRIDKINKALNENGISSIEEAKSTVESLQSINLWNKTSINVKIPEKLFKELRGKGLCKRL